jgi:hypothetical protein
MPTYDVEISHSITTTVPVEADSPEEAYEVANKQDFPLPSRDEWTGGKDWTYVVYSADGDELGRDDGAGYSGEPEDEDGDEDLTFSEVMADTWPQGQRFRPV